MNIVGHILVGQVQSIITGNWIYLLGNILPDITLIPNEVEIKDNEVFDDEKVPNYVMTMYFITHSLFFALLCYFINPALGIGVLSHQLIDWISHLGRFRTRPFYPISNFQIGHNIGSKRALLLSGGYDSVAILELIDRDKYDYFFFDYGQSYIREEKEAIEAVKRHYNIRVKEIKADWKTDIKNRNFLMMSRLQEMGYERISCGSRNILPIFDKYKDSNYVSLKIYGWVHRVMIETPLTFKTKKQIINLIPTDLIDKLYSTEKKK